MSQGTFSDLLIRLEAFKRIAVFRPEIDFFQEPIPAFSQVVSSRFWFQNEQIFKSAFFTPLCP